MDLLETHYHFIVWCCERIEPGTGNYIDNVVIDVLADNSGSALEKARRLVPGKKGGYFIRSVIEHVNSEKGCVNNHRHEE